MSTLRKMLIVLLYVGLVVCMVQSTAEAQPIEELNLPPDTTTRLVVREIRISGNSLISTGELLAGDDRRRARRAARRSAHL